MAKNFDPEIGKNTRWRKGQRSPNPGGRPRYSIVSAYLRQALEAGDADKIARSLLNLAKKGDIRAISEVIDRTEGKATQTMEVAVEESQPVSPDFRNMSKDELVEQIIETGIRLIGSGLEALNEEHIDGEMLQLRKAAPRLRELHQGLTSLIENIETSGIPSLESKDNAQAAESEWRTELTTAGGGFVKVYIGSRSQDLA
jgi:hypothetical protein